MTSVSGMLQRHSLNIIISIRHILETRTHLEKSGRVLIPAAFRKSLGLAPGDELILSLDDELHLLTPEQAVKRSQRIVRNYVKQGRSLSDELISERRELAKKE